MLFGSTSPGRSAARCARSPAARAASPAASWSLRLPQQGPGEIGELTRSFNEMADQIEQSHAELEQQNEELRESERMKTELVNIVSHELRTPLASVLGFTALLLKRDFDPPARRHYLGIVDAQARRLAALLEDFLDVQRIEHQGLDLVDRDDRPGHAPRRAGAALRRPEPEAPARGGPRRSARCPCAATPNRLAQVVGNLLSNAIKYSPGGRRGRAGCDSDRRRGAADASRDEGLGIPADQQERIFTKFFRGDAARDGHHRHRPRARGLARDRRGARRPDRLRQRPGSGLDLLGRAARARLADQGTINKEAAAT